METGFQNVFSHTWKMTRNLLKSRAFFSIFETIHNVTTTVLKMSIFDKKVTCCVSLKIVQFLLSKYLLSMSVKLMTDFLWKQSFAKHIAIQMMFVCVKLLPQESFPFSTILQEWETLFYVFLQQFFVWFASINQTMNRFGKDK